MLPLLPHKKNDIGRGKGRAMGGSVGKEGRSQLMDGSTVLVLRRLSWGGDLMLEFMCLNQQVHIFFSLTVQMLVSRYGACACVKCSVSV